MSVSFNPEEIKTYVIKERDSEETKEIYSKWAQNYEKDVLTGFFNGPCVLVKCFLELNVSKNAKILDVGAGTGKIGELLKQNGYENIDALDACPEMLEIAKTKNCYKNFIESYVDVNIVLPIEDKTYDIVLTAGSIVPGHIRLEALIQVIRVVKPGGVICMVDAHGRYKNWYTQKEYEDILDSFCQKGLCKSVEGHPKVAENLFSPNDCCEGYHNRDKLLVKGFKEFNKPKNVRILYVGAETGKVGQLLKQNGYENVDALDGCFEMLEVSKEKKSQNYIYKFNHKVIK